MTDEEKKELEKLSQAELVAMVAGYKDKSDAAEKSTKEAEEKAKQERLDIINKFFKGDAKAAQAEAKKEAADQDKGDTGPDEYEQRLINKFKWR